MLAHTRPGVRERERGFVDACGRCCGGSRRRLCCGRRGWRSRSSHRFNRSRIARRRAGRECEDHRAFGDFVADLHRKLLHGATERRRNVHRRFVRLESDQRILGFHRVTRLDHDLDHRHVLEVADVGHAHFGDACRRLRRRRRRRYAGFRRRPGRLLRTRRTAVEQQDRCAFAHLVADFDLHFLHRTGGRCRDVHRRLVGFERDERILRLHLVAHLYHHFDHRHILEVADVRYLDFGHCHVAPSYRCGASLTSSTDRAARYRARIWQSPLRRHRA